MDLDLTTEENKTAVKLMTDGEGEEIEDEIKAKVVVLAMNLKSKKITSQSTPGNQAVLPPGIGELRYLLFHIFDRF